MTQKRRYVSGKRRTRIYKPLHTEPWGFHLGYILLPYGAFYDKTKDFVDAKKGDILRFFNGGDYEIDNVVLIPQDRVCDTLCRMRYGISWQVAFEKWKSYAVLQGYGKDALSTEECLLVFYAKKEAREK